VRKLFFIRHGESQMNVKGYRSGHTNTPLTKLGRQQAKLAGQQARNHDIDIIVCSPLSRAHDTAKIAAREMGLDESSIHISSLLIERHYGRFEAQPYDPEIKINGFSDVESWDEMTKRAQLALKWIKSLDGHNVLVASHGAIGRAMRSLLMPKYNHKERIANAELVRWI
jgi:broad specificity phosphatase PhoE